jgi:hypothetical protein
MNYSVIRHDVNRKMGQVGQRVVFRDAGEAVRRSAGQSVSGKSELRPYIPTTGWDPSGMGRLRHVRGVAVCRGEGRGG